MNLRGSASLWSSDMERIETHPFEPFCPEDATTLILGSFPCFNGRDYGAWFYCGSGKSEFWRLLSETFGMPVENLEQKKDLCLQNRLALTDVAYRIRRKKNNCSDANLEIVEYNQAGITKCLSSGISRLLFTGKFVEKVFSKMFPDSTLSSEVLLSPSPAANRSIAGMVGFKEGLARRESLSVYEYRLSDYRKKLLVQRF